MSWDHFGRGCTELMWLSSEADHMGTFFYAWRCSRCGWRGALYATRQAARASDESQAVHECVTHQNWKRQVFGL